MTNVPYNVIFVLSSGPLDPFQGHGEGGHVGKGRMHPHFIAGPYVSIYKVITS